MNYNNKKFKAFSNTENGEVDANLVFHYIQQGNVLSCSYQGENILVGHLIGLVDEEGCIEMRYHQVNQQGELNTGICRSEPEILANGKIKLHEKWQWTSRDNSKGESVLIEI